MHRLRFLSAMFFVTREITNFNKMLVLPNEHHLGGAYTVYVFITCSLTSYVAV